MLRLPMHPRYSRMLVEASRRNCVRAAALCGKGDNLLVLGRRDGKQIEAAVAVFDQLATLPGASPAWRNQCLALHHALLQPLNAAPKLLAVDMADVMAVGARLAPLADALAVEAVDRVRTSRPPVRSALRCEQRAEQHASWEVRLFAS